MIKKVDNLTFKESITSAARNCYSKSFITPEETKDWNRSNDLIKDLLKAEHNTTMEHYNISLQIEGYSRHFIWRYLHGLHDFYVSDQQSQRYVHLDGNNFYYPSFLTKKDKDKWEHFYNYLINKYNDITDLLIKKGLNQKKSQEFARYIIPLGQTPHLTHTVNIITIIRYISYFEELSKLPNIELREEIEKFLNELKKLINDNKDLFDDLLKISKKKYNNLLSYNEEPIDINKTIELLNKNKINVINYTNMFKEYSKNNINNKDFDVLIKTNKRFEYFSTIAYGSHSLDSQNQRHRTTNKYRPLLKSFYNKLNKNYYIPDIIKEDNELNNIYNKTIKEMYEFFEEQSKIYGFENVLYLLPNAHNIIIFDIDNMEFYTHKAKKRLCWNAQEEIYHYTYQQIKQLQKYINIEDYNLLPPCHINYKNNIKPICPEGNRFCGTKVWKMSFNELNNRLI